MSWLSDHLFGITKSKDEIASPTSDGATTTPAPIPENPGAVPAPTSDEIQNDTVTTSDTAANEEPNAYEIREVSAEWQVPIGGKLHKIEFEHGTTSGKRILWIDEKV